jgi:dTDP-4-dehydrorhamnose reductase
MSDKKIIILGASGMLGNAMLRLLSMSTNHNVLGTVRSSKAKNLLPIDLQNNLVSAIDVLDIKSIDSLVKKIKPQILINCVGVIKQSTEVSNHIATITINSLLPHKLAMLAKKYKFRLVHISTDCVFSGNKGNYIESDFPDAQDLYGRSKLLGEIDDNKNITLRTSMIGHELDSSRSLINWFLNQNDQIKGYRNAIFSGLPAVEIASVIRDFVIPNNRLSGLYHLASDPINKYELLKLVSERYKKSIEIIPDNTIIIDRSLNGSLFNKKTGFKTKPWPKLILDMHNFG